uniref:Wall-associated receptor kinase galacturonan-binding domain-containing protein n=1 Tax=Chenopodium quinoa TaxID=63459 RepID=A0A803KTI8_CHEQI
MGVIDSCSMVILTMITVWLLFTPFIAGDGKAVTPSMPLVIASHCSDKCGNVSIPYPFGIEDGCYLEQPDITPFPSFKINCSHHHNSLPTIFGTNFGILNISVKEGDFHSKLPVSYYCYNQSGYVNSWMTWFNLVTFTLSSTKNILVAIGCDTYATFSGVRGDKEYGTGCMTKCVEPEDVIDGECTGVGCCQASIPGGINNVTVYLDSFNNHSSVYTFNPCNVAFQVAKDVFTFNRRYLSHDMEYYQGLALPVEYN